MWCSMVLLLVRSQILKVFSETENHISQIINKPLGKNMGGGGGGVRCRGKYTPYNCTARYEQSYSSNMKVRIV